MPFDTDQKRKLKLENALPCLLVQAQMLHIAFDERSISNLKTIAESFDRAMLDLLDSVKCLFSADTPRPSASFAIALHTALTTHETFMGLAQRGSPQVPRAECIGHMQSCIDLLDLVLDTVKAFLAAAHKELSRPRGLPEATESYDDGEHAPSPTLTQGSDFSHASSTTLVEDSSVHCITAKPPPTAKLPEDTLTRSHASPVDLRASIAQIQASAPPRNALWDVQLAVADGSDIVMNSSGEEILGASLMAIVRRLASTNALNEHVLAETFFLCFRDFSSPQDVVAALSACYFAQPPPGLSKEHCEAWRLQSKATQIRILALFRSWLELYWIESLDANAASDIMTFASKISKDWPQAGPKILGTLNYARTRDRSKARFRKRQEEIALDVAPKCRGDAHSRISVAPLLDDLCRQKASGITLPLLRFKDNLEEFARQLTHIAHKLYTAVKPEELLRYMMLTKQDPCALSRSLAEITTFHNAVSGWIALQILRKPDAKARAKTITIFLCLAVSLYTLRNYDTFTAVVHGIQHPSITRLEYTYAELSSDSRKLLHKMEDFLVFSGNFKHVRADMDSSCEPTVPLMAVYSHCFQALFGGPNKRSVANPKKPGGKLPNIFLYKAATKITRAMEQWHLPYMFPTAPHVQSWIRDELAQISKMGLDAVWDEAYKISKTLEPTGDHKKPRNNKSGALRSLASLLSKNGKMISDTASLKAFNPRL
ncbi:ras GEF [Dentipellis sp. KUC8613]|nr:ras GEF [Dentipellis sp. KUC8613]